MNEVFPTDELLREIARYLAAVDLFRAERCEPTWRPEPQATASSAARPIVAYGEPTPQPAH